MANNGKLVFPIGFDLEAAVKEAQKDWPSCQKRLIKMISKKDIPVNLSLNIKKLDTLDDVKKRLAALRIQPIDPKNAAAIKDLVQQLKALARAMEKVQRFKGIELPELQKAKAAKYQVEVAQANERLRLAQERVRQAEERLILSQKRAEQQARNTGRAYTDQSAALNGMERRLAALASISMVSDYLTKVREVTAEFELQKVSLGSIVQDEEKGKQIFSEIKGFALKTPVSILDLTKYTKQLAAYRIETDKLFETTTRLADISVAMGQNLDRLILAYGQIRARGFLAGGEAKQLMEYGIPITELLAEKLSKVNGELVRASDVLDMMSKRQIPFETVAEVFEDLTNKGGMFYNMQEKQGNTLYGMWAKLGDAASVMYEEIGNTGPVNAGMKATINTLRSLMLSWRQVATVAGVVTTAVVANIVAQRNARIEAAASTAANLKNVASLKAQEVALVRQIALNKSAGLSANLVTRSTLAATRAQIQAATATNVFSKSLYGLKAALLSNPVGILAVALTSIIGLIMTAEDKVGELRSKLTDIEADYNAEGKKMKERFVELAEVAVGSVDGSKRQKDALDELNRTYGNILGSEALEIESLKKLGGQYQELTEIIEAYNAKRKRDAEQTEIKSNFSSQIEDAKKNLTGYLKGIGLDDVEISEFFDNYREKVNEGADATQTLIDMWNEAYNSHKSFVNTLRQTPLNLFGGQFWHSLGMDWDQLFKSGDWSQILTTYARLMDEQNQRLDESEAKYRDAANALGVYSTGVESLNTAFASLDWSSMETLYTSLQDYNAKHPDAKLNIPIDFTFDPAKADSSYEKMLETANAKISSVFSNIRTIASEEGVAIPEEFYNQAKSVVEGNKGFSFINWDELIKLPFSDKAKRAIEAMRQLIEKLAPSDDTAQVFNQRFMALADGMGLSLDAMQKYLMKGGVKLEEHRKGLSESITKLLADIARLQFTKKLRSLFGLPTEAIDEEIQKAKDEVQLLQKVLAEVPDFEAIGKKGKKSDTRLQTLNKIEQALTSINAKYDELRAKEGDVKALEHVNDIYKTQLSYLNRIGKKFGLSFDLPTSFKSLQEYRGVILNVIESLKKSGLSGAETAAIDLEMKIAEGNVSKLQKDIEEQIKELSERISRTKTAKEFYDKILSETGDVNLAAKVSTSIYGTNGDDLYDDMVKYIQEVFKSGTEGVEIDLTPVFDTDNQRINWENLADIYSQYQGDLIKENRKAAKDIVDEGRKTSAENILTWQKELAKAKSFEEQRTDIINRETQRRAEIYKSNLPREEKERLAGQSRTKQSEDLAKVNFEEFTKSEDYIKIFENLDNTSTAALKRLREEMQKLIETNKDLSPENMKTLVKAMEDIDEQISGRGFGNDMVQGVRDYIDALRDLKTAKAELKASQAEFDAQLPQLDADIETAKAEEIAAQEELNALKAQELQDVNAIVAAQLRLNNATKGVTLAEQAKAKAADKVKKAEAKVTNQQDKQRKATSKFFNDMQQVAQTADQLASVLGEVEELLGVSADSAEGVAFDSAIQGLQEFSKLMNVIIGLQTLYNIVTSSNPWLAIAAAVLAVGSILGNWISNNKVRKANKEIERQQELLDQLQYTYSRLEKVADKVFGTDYIRNYKQELKNLNAQAVAYQKQAEAEKSKGKKTDKEKVKEYEDAWRDTMDEIADMQGQIAEKMLGTDLASAARDFASAWLEAYQEVGRAGAETSDKMKEKFQDMLKNMVVEGALAAVMQKALQPMYDMINDMNGQDFYSESFWKKVSEMAKKGAEDADNGAQVLMKFLKQSGISMEEINSEYTGIAKSVATATSEEINALAAAVNTQNYYMSGIPGIASNVAHIAEILRSGTQLPTETVPGVDFATYHANSLAQLGSLNNHAAQILTECQRSTRAAEETAREARNIAEKLNRVVTFEGGKFVVNTVLKG